MRLRVSSTGGVRATAIIAQLVIVAGLLAWFKFYLPRLERARAAERAAQRESKILTFFESMVVENDNREVPQADGATASHPQKLRSAASVEEAEQALGTPQARLTDFRGGLHLTWTGTGHKLEASFDKGHLYSLRLEDLRTGHGTMVFESSLYWHLF